MVPFWKPPWGGAVRTLTCQSEVPEVQTNHWAWSGGHLKDRALSLGIYHAPGRQYPTRQEQRTLLMSGTEPTACTVKSCHHLRMMSWGDSRKNWVCISVFCFVSPLPEPNPAPTTKERFLSSLLPHLYNSEPALRESVNLTLKTCTAYTTCPYMSLQPHLQISN